ncbi:preprotein translocase subunit YajC [Ligilactobacillus ceti]|nr:preprotein translocase subunit YajC [Ligilactobacillus ceti]
MNSTFTTIGMFVVLMLVMYFMMLRPQKKQQKARQEMMDGLSRGNEVITIGGLHGVIDSIDRENKTVTLDCEGVYLVFDIPAIRNVISKTAAVTPEVKPEVKEEVVETVEEIVEEKPADKE